MPRFATFKSHAFTSLLLTIGLTLALVGTAVAVSTSSGTVEPPPTFAFVVRADSFPDALAAGPVAGRLNAPLFLTDSENLDTDVELGLQTFDPEVVVIAGGTVAISTSVEQQLAAVVPDAQVRRVAGGTRTETAAALANLITEYNPAFLPSGGTATDADLLDGKDSNEFALKSELGTGGGDADTLDGKDSTDFLGVNDTATSAADADLLDGKDSTDFLGVNDTATSAADANLLDGKDSTAFAAAGHTHATFSHVEVVAADGTASANGDTLLDAVNGLSATATEPWLVLVEPGTFDLGSNRLSVPAHVDLAGSGQGVTTIRGTGGSSSAEGVIQPSSDVTVRDLTVEASGGSTAVAMSLSSSYSDITIERVTATSSGATSVDRAISAFSTDVVIRDSTIKATGDGSTTVNGVYGYNLLLDNVDIVTAGDGGGTYGHRGVWSVDGDTTLINTRVTATGTNTHALHASHVATFTVRGGSFTGDNYGIYVSTDNAVRVQGAQFKGATDAARHYGTGSFQLVDSTLDGTVNGTISCAGVYDATPTFYANTCP